MERYAPVAKDLASRDVVSRSMTIEIREGRYGLVGLYGAGGFSGRSLSMPALLGDRWECYVMGCAAMVKMSVVLFVGVTVLIRLGLYLVLPFLTTSTKPVGM